MKKRTIKTNIMAAVLAAVTACSAGTMAMATTVYAADSSSMSESDKIMIIDMTSEAAKELLDNVPGGKIFSPLLMSMFKRMSGLSTTTLESISNQISELQTQVTRSTNELKRTIEDSSSLVGYRDDMINLQTTVDSIVRQINNIDNVRAGEKLPTNNERLVAYAAKIGNHDEWINNKGNLIYMLNKVSSYFDGDGFVDSRNIFEILYSTKKSESMFSGEAMEKAAPYIANGFNIYMYAYSVAVLCLDAQVKLMDLSQNDISALGQNYQKEYDKLYFNYGDITGEMKELFEKITGNENQSGILQTYKKYEAKNPLIFIDEGNANVTLDKNIVFARHTSDYMSAPNNTLSVDQAKKIADFLRKQNRHISLYDYLTERGFVFKDIDDKLYTEEFKFYQRVKTCKADSKEEFLYNLKREFSADDIGNFIGRNNLSKDFEKFTGFTFDISNGLNISGRPISGTPGHIIVGGKKKEDPYKNALYDFFNDYVYNHYYNIDDVISNYKNNFGKNNNYYLATGKFDSYSFSSSGMVEVKKYYNGVSLFDSSVSEQKITYYSFYGSMTKDDRKTLDGSALFFGNA